MVVQHAPQVLGRNAFRPERAVQAQPVDQRVQPVGLCLQVLPVIGIVLAVWFATGPLWEWVHGLVAPPGTSPARAVESRGASASKG